MGFIKTRICLCKKYECCRSIIRSIIENAKEQGIVILTQPSVNAFEGTCPRSDGTVSGCLFERVGYS